MPITLKRYALKTAHDDRNKTKHVDNISKMIKHLEDDFTSPEALALLQRQEGLVKYYFPKWRHSDSQLQFVQNFIRNKIMSGYMKSSGMCANIDKWFKIVENMGKEQASGGEVIIEVK
jgi:hypothetical protein